MNRQRIENRMHAGPHSIELCDKVALALCVAGFGAVGGVIASGGWLERSMMLVGVLIFLAFQAAALLLGTLTRHRPLGRAALIVAALSFSGGIFLFIGLLTFFIVDRFAF